MRAATIAAKIGVAPLSIPVTLDDTRSSASGNNDNGRASHTTPSNTSVGHAVRGTGWRVVGTDTTTRKPNRIRIHVTTNGWNESSPSAIRKKLEPQIKPGNANATQSRGVNARSSG